MKRLEVASRNSAPELVEELLDVVEPLRLAGEMLGFGLTNLGEEEGPAEGAELRLIAFEAFRVHDIGRRARALHDDRRLVAGLDVIDDLRDPLAEVADGDRLHTCTVQPNVRLSSDAIRKLTGGRCRVGLPHDEQQAGRPALEPGLRLARIRGVRTPGR